MIYNIINFSRRKIYIYITPVIFKFSYFRKKRDNLLALLKISLSFKQHLWLASNISTKPAG